jgi:hypothetical protein
MNAIIPVNTTALPLISDIEYKDSKHHTQIILVVHSAPNLLSNTGPPRAENETDRLMIDQYLSKNDILIHLSIIPSASRLILFSISTTIY